MTIRHPSEEERRGLMELRDQQLKASFGRRRLSGHTIGLVLLIGLLIAALAVYWLADPGTTEACDPGHFCIDTL